MNPWFESIVCICASLAMGLIAWRTVQLRFFWFGAGLISIAVALWYGPVLYHRSTGMLMTLAIPMVVGPLFQFPLSRRLCCGIVFAAVMTMCQSGWMEFLAPAFARGELSRLETRISPSGVCLQGTGYTCGPAAAVTILRRHGFPAEESDLALLGKASEFTGTDGPGLVEAIERRFGQGGVKAESVCWRTVEELQRAENCIVVIRYDRNIDHWVALLEVTSDNVVMGDPISGRRIMKREKFAQEWTGEAVRFIFPRQAAEKTARNPS